MRRREFIRLLGGAAVAWPLAARAQQPAQIKRVGMLMGFANDALGQVSVKAFQQELERLGWAEGRSVAFEFRWAEGRSERFADFAAEFVRLRVDVILTTATPSTAAAMRRHRKLRSSLWGLATRLEAAWLRASRGRAATSPAFRTRTWMSPANESRFYARLCLGCGDWGSCTILAIPS